MKFCSRCHGRKFKKDFGANRSNADGLQRWCKACFTAYAVEWKEAHPGYFKNYYKDNPEKFDMRAAKRPHLLQRPCIVEDCASQRHVSPSGYIAARCITHHNEENRRKYELTHPPRVPIDPFVRSLAKRGLSSEQYERMLTLQGHRCRVCMSHPKHGGLVIDHDHSCCNHKPTLRNPWCGQCIRGLLCNDCNTALGFLRDDPRRAINAAYYLKNGGTHLVRDYSRKDDE